MYAPETDIYTYITLDRSHVLHRKYHIGQWRAFRITQTHSQHNMWREMYLLIYIYTVYIISQSGIYYIPEWYILYPRVVYIISQRGIYYIPEWYILYPRVVYIISQSGIYYIPEWYILYPRVVYIISQSGIYYIPEWYILYPRVVYIISQSGIYYIPEWYILYPRVVYIISQSGIDVTARFATADRLRSRHACLARRSIEQAHAYCHAPFYMRAQFLDGSVSGFCAPV